MYIWKMLESIGSLGSSTYASITSNSKQNEYRLETLDNGMLVLLARDPSLTVASFCLGVEAGCQNDPAEIEGIAQLTEHLISRLSKVDIAVKNGLLADMPSVPSTDLMSYTEQHNTVYTLRTTDKDIGVAADIMAKVMAAPLFKPADIALEIAAIDTKFELQTNNPSFINTDVVADLQTADGYVIREGLGNKRTLEHLGTAESVKQFWERNYYGEKMNLVIFSSLSFEEMRKVANRFEQIRSNPNIGRTNESSLDQNEMRRLLTSFRPAKDLKLKEDALQYIYRTNIAGHVSAMHISVILPSIQKYDQFVPLGLIESLINYHLDTDAKARLNDLGCVISTPTAVHYDRAGCVMLTIELPLTTQGVAHYKEILDVVLGTLKSVDLSEDSVKSWVERKRTIWKATASKYMRNLVRNTSQQEIIRYSIGMLNDSSLYEMSRIEQGLIRDLFRCIADFNDWIVVIMDKDHKLGKEDTYCSINNTCYERERKPSYSPESQWCAYTHPEGEDALRAQGHGSCNFVNPCTSDSIHEANCSQSKMKKQLNTLYINIQGDAKYRCLTVLLLELARLEMQAAQSGEKRGTDDKVLITLYTKMKASMCIFIVCFSTEGTKDVLHKACEQYIEAANSPRISDAFEVAKACALYHHYSEATLPMIYERVNFFSTGNEIDLLAQTEAISSLRNEEILGMSILKGVYHPDSILAEKNDGTTNFGLCPISLPNYLARCKLPESANTSTGLCITEPICNTLAYSYFQYEICHAYVLLHSASGIKLNVESVKKPLCDMYNAFMSGLIAHLLKSAFMVEMAQTKLHATNMKVDTTYTQPNYSAGVYFALLSKAPMEDHVETIDAFILDGNDVIANISSDSFNRAFETMMEEMPFDHFVKNFTSVKNDQTLLDAEILEQKRQIREFMTQKNIVSIYGSSVKCGRKLFIPARQSGISA